MENKELEVLNALGRLVNNVELDTKYWHNKMDDDYKLVKKALQRLEAIDNAKPNEALECIDVLKEDGCITTLYQGKALETIKQAFIKAQAQDQVIKECIKLLSVDGANTKAKVKQMLEELIK